MKKKNGTYGCGFCFPINIDIDLSIKIRITPIPQYNIACVWALCACFVCLLLTTVDNTLVDSKAYFCLCMLVAAVVSLVHTVKIITG